MNKEFSIYDSPFSEETKKIRRNSLLFSGLSLFIGLSGKLPTEFLIFGMSFSNEQQSIIGWFIFALTIYHFLHFLSQGMVELGAWIQPFYVYINTRKVLLRHPAFDETDFMNIPGPSSGIDKDLIYLNVKGEVEWKSKKTLRFLFNWIYLNLFIVIIVPVVIGAWGLLELCQLITSHCS